jgi:hypothetical protein
MINPDLILIFAGGFLCGATVIIWLVAGEVQEAERIIAKKREEDQYLRINGGGYFRDENW